MFRFKQTLLTLSIIIGLATVLPLPIQAAQFYSGSTLNFSTSDKLQDAYIAGQTINVNTPVTNDLVVVGGTITIQQNIDNGLLAAGGTVTVNANVGQSARVAGGTVIINGQVNRDVVVAGGDVTITKTAKVLGDVVVYAGTITIDGPVDGKVTLNGGKATINSTVGSVTDSRIDSLTLGSQAVINGDLQYQSPQEVQLNQGAMVKGQTTYHRTTQSTNQPVRGLATFGFFYNIIAGLIFSLVLLWLTHKVTNQSVLHLKQSPGLTFAWGLGATFLFPIVAILAAILSIYLGIASFIFYIFCLIVAIYLAQILLGWWLLNWWLGRNKETYNLDWRAVVVGVAVATILMLVPIIGWLILAFLTIMSMGSLARQVWSMRQGG